MARRDRATHTQTEAAACSETHVEPPNYSGCRASCCGLTGHLPTLRLAAGQAHRPCPPHGGPVPTLPRAPPQAEDTPGPGLSMRNARWG